MIKIFHEAPKCIFKEVQQLTDGDYALVNLFDQDPAYYNLFRDAVRQGREVILDNGVFELGTAWSADKFAEWVERLQPTYYIVPDVLEDGPATVASFLNFTQTYAELPGKIIGVVQGRTLEEFIECYEAIEPYCDKVGISFDCSWYKDLEPSPYLSSWQQLMWGRVKMLMRLCMDGVINTEKPHHLLGVALPQEMGHYKYLQWKWIDSVDTSNPVVHGLKHVMYTHRGLKGKETQKLYTLINSDVDESQRGMIKYNIEMFREFCNGET